MDINKKIITIAVSVAVMATASAAITLALAPEKEPVSTGGEDLSALEREIHSVRLTEEKVNMINAKVNDAEAFLQTIKPVHDSALTQSEAAAKDKEEFGYSIWCLEQALEVYRNRAEEFSQKYQELSKSDSNSNFSQLLDEMETFEISKDANELINSRNYCEARKTALEETLKKDEEERIKKAQSAEAAAKSKSSKTGGTSKSSGKSSGSSKSGTNKSSGSSKSYSGGSTSGGSSSSGTNSSSGGSGKGSLGANR